MTKLGSKTLLVLASTYPRWPQDKVPNFVENFVTQMTPVFKAIRVIVPHYKGAQRKEQPGPTVTITRFRYAYPYSFEDIAYGEFKKNALYPIKTLLYVAAELWTTFVVTLRSRPVVVNAHWLIPQGFVAVLLKPLFNNKVVISVHGADVFTLNGAAMRKVKRFVLRRADAVVVNSSATQEVCRGIFDRDYPIIPMGVDTNRFSRQGKKQAGKTLELLFVGRVTEEKGVEYLCQAVAALHKQHRAVHLTIVGDGPLRPQLENYVADNHLSQAITLAGWVQQSQLAPYYEQADIFVGPSIEHVSGWREAFGVVFAEASAMGLPVITTSTGGIKDIIKHEVNGLVVPQKDSGAIVSALERLQGDPKLRETLGRNGRRYIQDNFSWEVIAARYTALFKQL